MSTNAVPSYVPPPWDAEPTAPRPRLGELLMRRGFIDEKQLSWALGEASAKNELLGIVLLRARLIFEDELARTLSEQLSIPYLNIGHIGVDAGVARLLPAEVGTAVAAIPVRVSDGVIQVAFGDPTDPKALAAVEEALPQMSIAVAEMSAIQTAWRSLAR